MYLFVDKIVYEIDISLRIVRRTFVSSKKRKLVYDARVEYIHVYTFALLVSIK